MYTLIKQEGRARRGTFTTPHGTIPVSYTHLEYLEQEEDVLTWAMFPQVAPKFFEKRKNKKYGVDGEHADKKDMVHPV